MTSRRQALLRTVGEAIQAYQRATDGFDDVVGRRLRLNPADLRSLDWLTQGPRSAGQLAEATGLSSAAMTTLLDRLERRGFVRRTRDAADRRRVLVELTPEGSAALAEMYGPLADEGEGLLARFSDDQLAQIAEFLRDATAVVDRHRARVASAADMQGAP